MRTCTVGVRAEPGAGRLQSHKSILHWPCGEQARFRIHAHIHEFARTIWMRKTVRGEQAEMDIHEHNHSPAFSSGCDGRRLTTSNRRIGFCETATCIHSNLARNKERSAFPAGFPRPRDADDSSTHSRWDGAGLPRDRGHGDYRGVAGGYDLTWNPAV